MPFLASSPTTTVSNSPFSHHRTTSSSRSSSPRRLPMPRGRPLVVLLALLGTYGLLHMATSGGGQLVVKVEEDAGWKAKGMERIDQWREGVGEAWERMRFSGGWGKGAGGRLGEGKELEGGRNGDGGRMGKDEAERIRIGHGQEELRICDRTMLITLSSSHGFASTYLTYLHALDLARHYNYTLLVDDSEWNYGLLSDYFLSDRPEDLPASAGGCRRSPNWLEQKRLQALRGDETNIVLDEELVERTSWGAARDMLERTEDEHWLKAKHVVLRAKHTANLDLSILLRSVDLPSLTRLHTSDRAQILRLAHLRKLPPPQPLHPSDVFPELFRDAFLAQIRFAKSHFRLNNALERQIAHLASELDLPNQLPSTGPDARKRSVGEAVIAVHVRLGDKALEIHAVSPLRFLTPQWIADNLTPLGAKVKDFRYPYEYISAKKQIGVVMEAAGKALSELEEEFDLEGEGRPTLLVLSDDDLAMDLIRRHDTAAKWRIVDPSRVPLFSSSSQASLNRRSPPSPSEQHQHELERALTSTSDAPLDKEELRDRPGFNELAWNAMPEEERRDQAVAFVRDLAFAARVADAVVQTSTSNVGRLWSLLVAGRWLDGEEREGERAWREARRRVWSADTRWYPTSYFF